MKIKQPTLGRIAKAYLLYINIEDSRKHLKKFHNCNALQKIEVEVKIDGERKSFTFKDFKTRLGF
jgi:hypothetical protein